MPEQKSHLENCHGFCTACQRPHSLPEGNAQALAFELIREMESSGRLDFESETKNPELEISTLFDGKRGSMFGVMECEDGTVLKAFSSLPGGIRIVPGWVPSILPEEDFQTRVYPGQVKIKKLSAQMKVHEKNSAEYDALFQERKIFSQSLMREIHGMYRFTNFRGETKPLHEAFLKPYAMPGGVGDCCAPKMLNFAAQNGLRPKGVAEFFWGGSNSSGRKKAGEFFPCCEDKCQPILGFMLCGLDD